MEIADVRNSVTLEAVLADGVERVGRRLDVVVANAGISNWARFWEMSDEQWRTMIDINLIGVWGTMKAAVPHMLSAGNGGSIITVSSVAGIKALPCQSHYTAAKHGVVGLTKSAVIELGKYNIRVNSIHPWGSPQRQLKTRMSKRCSPPTRTTSCPSAQQASPARDSRNVLDVADPLFMRRRVHSRGWCHLAESGADGQANSRGRARRGA
jgi:hypothetical protein